MVEDNHKHPTTELETFLPKDESKLKDGALIAKYKVQVASKDVELATRDDKSFDPFLERNVPKPTTDCDTLTHLLKASLGTGILSMPAAFAGTGLFWGIILTIVVAAICTHCAYVLVKCAHVHYYKSRRTQMDFAEVSETAFANGPKWARWFSLPSRYVITTSLFAAYFGTCTAYSIIIAGNLYKAYNAINKDLELAEAKNPNLTIYLLALMIPLVLICWVPNLKYLAPVSMIANLCMVAGLGITFYYLCTDLETPKFDLETDLSKWPEFMSITIFAIEAIGVVMPLENNMKTPQNFVGLCGVLNKGSAGVTLIYILLGFLGAARYQGGTVEYNITLNLPALQKAAIAVQFFIAIAVFCTFALQFFVCLEIIWTGIRDRFQKKATIANYVLRTVLVVCAVGLAIALPKIKPIIGLIGALCFSILGLIMPVLIETVTYWDVGFGRFNWVAIKNVLILIFGIVALVAGTQDCVKDIIKTFS